MVAPATNGELLCESNPLALYGDITCSALKRSVLLIPAGTSAIFPCLSNSGASDYSRIAQLSAVAGCVETRDVTLVN